MHADFFIRAAVEWVAIADAIRVKYPTATGSFHWVVTGLYREAAWCHLLVRSGRGPTPRTIGCSPKSQGGPGPGQAE